jgi:hypothetical protein
MVFSWPSVLPPRWAKTSGRDDATAGCIAGILGELESLQGLIFRRLTT